LKHLSTPVKTSLPDFVSLISAAVFLLSVCAFSATGRNSSLDKWHSIAKADTLDVFLGQAMVGTLTHTTSVSDSAQSVCVTTILHVDGKAAGAPVMLDMLEQRDYAADGAVFHIKQILSAASGKNTWELLRGANGWNLKMSTGGVESTAAVNDIHENLGATYSLYKSVMSGTCKIGDVFTDTAFEVMSQKNIAARYTCIAIDAKTGVLTFGVIDDLTGKAEKWQIDTTGSTLMQEIEGMFVARKKTLTNTNSNGSAAEKETVDIATIFAIAKDRKPALNERIAVTLTTGTDIDESVRQLYDKMPKYWLLKYPVKNCYEKNKIADISRFREFTRPTVTMQSDDTLITGCAKKLGLAALSPCDAIRIATQYVYSSLDKRNSATFSNAVETIKAGFGDCGEHAVLLAALLRNAKIPARVVLGTIYYEPAHAFAGHAWVTAFNGAEWVTADPSFGKFPAPNDRIPLMLDDDGRGVFLLIRYVGAVKVEYAALDK